MRISSEFGADLSAGIGTKEAWAYLARRRWPANGVKSAMAEWDLTEGEAKGLFAAQVSQPTIDKIIDHPRGGFGLGLQILEIRTKTALRTWIQSEEKRLADEAARAARDADALAEMARRLPVALGLGGSRAGGVGARRPGRLGEARSFDRPRAHRGPE